MIACALVRVASLTLLAWALVPRGAAHAFCRATTINTDQSACVCETEGYPLAWESPDIEYTFNERGFPDFTDAQLRGIFSEAVDTWQDVVCDGARVPLDVRAASETTALEPRPKELSPLVNVMGYLSAEEWEEQKFGTHVFAQTGVRYYPNSGVIAGADIWFNGGMGTFGVCPTNGCEDVNSLIDLPNVVTHELGHFLGLAHSRVDGSTMACDALPGQTDKRSLAADDRRGLCAIYPPEQAFRGPYEAGEWTEAQEPDDCSVRAPGAARARLPLAGLGFALIALVGLGRSRRQPGRGSS